MRVKRKAAILLAAPMAALFLSGCGGFQAAPTISPASFFMPGLIRNDHKQDAPQETPVQSPDTPAKDPVLVAQAR